MPLRSWVVSTIANAVVVQVAEQVEHLVAGAHVDARRRLVEQQQLRAGRAGRGR